jgi:hypothetical protein
MNTMGVLIIYTKGYFVQKHEENVLDFMEGFLKKSNGNGTKTRRYNQ